jgi:FkbM family methyltransferase
VISELMARVAAGRFRGSFLLASWLARLAGRDRWLRVTFGGRVSITADLAVPKYWILRRAKSEEPLCRFFMAALRPGDVVYDVGANWGLYTLLSAALVGNSGRVASFEPGSAAIGQLRAHLAEAKVSNVKVNHCAVTRAGGAAVDLVLPGPGHADTGAHLGERSANKRVERVASLALDDFWKTEGRPHIRLLKVDVEGAEAAVLEGASALLEEGQCDYVVMETGIYSSRYGARPKDAVNLLARHGYSHIFRFVDAPPYLAAITGRQIETLNDNVCASFRPLEEVIGKMNALEKKAWTPD